MSDEIKTTNKNKPSEFYNPFIKSGVDLDLILSEGNFKSFINLSSSLSDKREGMIDSLIGVFVSRTLEGVLSDLTNGKGLFFLTMDCKADLIKFDVKRFRRIMGIRSDASAYKFLGELMDCGLLMKRSKGYYWINPFMFFPGTVSVRYLYYKEKFREVARDKYPDVYVKHYL